MEDSPSLPDKVKKAQATALEILPLLRAKLAQPDGNVHAGTVLAAAAWLTGNSLYRSFNFETKDPPGTLIKSSDVNQEWESLMFLLEQFSFGRTDIPVGRLMMAGMEAPASFRSQREMLQVEGELQGLYQAVMKKHGFDALDGARAGIVLCSILIQQYAAARIVDTYAAAGIVAEQVLEAAKTVPPPMQ